MHIHTLPLSRELWWNLNINSRDHKKTVHIIIKNFTLTVQLPVLVPGDFKVVCIKPVFHIDYVPLYV